jgi:DNA-binding response OmpR family regulator
MKTILLVEDEEAIRTPLAELLAEADEYRVIQATNGREAVNAMIAKSVDLVITDLKMPVMDGFTLLAHLMHCHPAVPVIVITAYGGGETRAKLRALGTPDVIEKPTDFKALPGLVRAKLAQRAEGRIVGITLPGFLQLLNLEQKTCILSIRSRGRKGRLSCVAGELTHAEVGASLGLDALYEVLRWDDPEIEIGGAPSLRERTIDAPLSHILLEAARLKDEERQSDVEVRAASARVAAAQGRS